MKAKVKEKRSFPRISIGFPIKIPPSFLAQGIDISETGLSFILDKPLLLSKAKAEIEISSIQKIETEFKVIWSKQLVEDKKFRYGVAFVRLKERDLDILREILISNYIEDFLEKIDNSNIREKVSNFFTKDVKNYLKRISYLEAFLGNKGMSSQEIGEELAILNRSIVEKAEKFKAFLDNIQIKYMKKVFREIVNPWTNKGYLPKRGLEKPKGYPGDYELLEHIYNNKPVSEGIGFYYDKDFLSNEYAKGVRERKDKIKQLLKEFIKNVSNDIKILNLACGGCRELRELFAKERFRPPQNINFTCIDQDEDALKYAQKRLRKVPPNIKFNFLKEDIIRIIFNESKSRNMLGNYNLIYSIGLADYLPDRVLKKIILFYYFLLEKKGQLIIAHKDTKKVKPLHPNWFCNWEFYNRDKEDLINLIKKIDLKNFSLKEEYISLSNIFFITLIKNGI